MVLERLKDCTAKVQEWRQITDEYNKGQFTPELFKIKGQRKERCLRLWVEKYLQNERDMFALIHKSKNQTKGRKVTYLEQQFLLKLLLTPRRSKSAPQFPRSKIMSGWVVWNRPVQHLLSNAGSWTGKETTWQSGLKRDLAVKQWQRP